MLSKVWDGITHLFLNFNDATVEVYEWLGNFMLGLKLHARINHKSDKWSAPWPIDNFVFLVEYPGMDTNHLGLEKYGPYGLRWTWSEQNRIADGQNAFLPSGVHLIQHAAIDKILGPRKFSNDVCLSVSKWVIFGNFPLFKAPSLPGNRLSILGRHYVIPIHNKRVTTFAHWKRH